MINKALRYIFSVLLSLQLFIAPSIAASADCCLPKSRLSQALPSSESSIIDFTVGNLKPSTEYRIAHSTSSDFILIDSASINKESSFRALQRSKATIVLRTEQGRNAANHLLEQEILGVDVLATIPEDAHGVNLMYNSDTGKFPQVVNHYAKVSADLKQISGVKVISKRPNSSKINAILLNEAKSKEHKNRMFIIIGHNEEGKLRLPDGSNISVSELVNASSESGRPILILSCETLHSNIYQSGFVTTRALFFDEIVKAMHYATAQSHPKTVAQVIRNINEGFVPASTSGKNYTITAVTFAGGSVILATVYANTSPDCKGHPLRLACISLKK